MDLTGAVSLLQVLLGVAAECFILKYLLGYSVKKGKWRIPALTVTLLITLTAGLLFLERETADLLVEAVVMLSFVAAPYLLFKSNKKSTFLLFGLTVCSVIDFVVFGITSVFVSLNEFYSSFVYCAFYVACIAVSFIFYKKRKNPIPYGFLEQIPMLVYIVIFLAGLSTFYSITENSDPMYFSDVGNALMLISVILVVVCISYAFFRYSNLSRNQKETERMLDMQLRHYEDMVSKNRDIRSFRHDYKNNLISIYSLVDKGKNSEALEYIKNLNESLATAQSRFSTGNYLADAILSDKALSALKSGVELDFNGSIPQEGISNNDLCTVLSNAVDNAVRGCDGMAPCKVKITSVENENGFVLNVSNPVLNKVEIKNNAVKTSKSDKENHGFGVELIKKTAKKYNGFVKLNCDNNIFTITVGFIKNREVDKNEVD